SSTGLVKNDPALLVSGSAGSRTIPLPRRNSSTASLTSASGACSPTPTPSLPASSAYLTGLDIGSRYRAKVTSVTTYLPVGLGDAPWASTGQPVVLNRLVR